MEIRHALAEGNEGRAEQLHARALLRAGRLRQLQCMDVPQGRVVVVLDIVDDLPGLVRVAGFHALVVQCRERCDATVCQRGAVVAQGAGKASAGQVGGMQQVTTRRLATSARVRRMRKTVEQSLREQGIATVAAAATAQRITGAIAERGDAAAVQHALRGLREAHAIGDFAEIPALADHRDVATRSGIRGALHLDHLRARLVTHQVEAERVDAIVPRPHRNRIAHQPRHHPVLGRGVVAAGRGLHLAVRIQPLVVAGHDPVQHRARRLPGRGGVVVDHVHAHAQAGRMQCLDHCAEFADTHGAIRRIAGVAAFRRVEVERVIAPVEAVVRGDGHRRRLLVVAVRRSLRDHGCDATRLRDRGDVEHRQQVDVGDARFAQGAQVAHAVAVGIGEGEVLAAMRDGHGGIVHREIAHVQFVECHVGVRRQRGWSRRIVPADRLQCGIIEIGDVAARRIGGEAGRVRIGDAIADDAGAGHEDVDQIGVIAATQVVRQEAHPCAIALLDVQRDLFTCLAVAIIVEADGDRDCGRCPDRECGFAVEHVRTERHRLRRPVQNIQRTRRLQVGRIDHIALRVLADQHHLRAQQVAERAPCRLRNQQCRAVAGERETSFNPIGHAIRR